MPTAAQAQEYLTPITPLVRLHCPSPPYIHTRDIAWVTKEIAKGKRKMKKNSWEKLGKNCELNPLAACRIPIGPMYPNVHPDMHMDMDCQWSCVSKCLSLSLSLSHTHTHTLCVQVCAMYVSNEGFDLGFAATMHANVTNKTQRCEIKNDIWIQIE